MAYRDRIEALIAQYGERIAEAFLAAFDDIRNSITLRIVVERLERGDINGAVQAMGLDPIAFERLERVMAEAYASGGDAEVDNIPPLRDPGGARVLFRFATRNTPGEEELRRRSSTLVTNIAEEQREVIRETLAQGLSEGVNPRALAPRIIGTVNRVTNRREGGIIGLSRPQARYVVNARAELASGDPEQLRAYLRRERRDKRFDRTILKAIREEKAPDGRDGRLKRSAFR
jgi:hypothetical protein